MKSELLTASAADSTGQRPPTAWAPQKFVFPLVYLLASMHLVWFYVYRVPSYLVLTRYEAGTERMPFQARLLMQYPLRWAHGSAALGSLAAALTRMHLWLPHAILPEDIALAAIDLVAVLIAGLVATDLYRTHSRTRLLTAYVYPLVLVMIAGSYCFGSINFFRYFYDLPSLGLFSAGLYLISRRSHPALFAALFVVATVNRETSLFLLFFFLASACVVEERVEWRRALRRSSGGTAVLLGLFWLGWRIWTQHHFAGLQVESGTGVLANFACLIFPALWPQLVGIAAYTLPVLVLYRGELRCTELRLWLWVFPLWFSCMMYFGNLIEVRLFGELIPVFACVAALVAEERILRAHRARPAEVLAGEADRDPIRSAGWNPGKSGLI